MRSENSVKNSLFAIIGQTVSLIFGFVTRKVFIDVLGETYLGINGVFCSILSLLSLTELGIGSAITFSLYKPIAEHDDEQTGRIMNLYALAYQIVAAAVTLLGLCILPFIGKMTVEVPNLRLIYLLYLANSAASYLFSYRKALITAAEKDWRNTLNNAIFQILQNLAQLVILLYTGNYILYLSAQLLCTIASNLEISYAASKLFPFLGRVKGLPDSETSSKIKANVASMFMTRFGSVAVTGTDNLLISTVSIALTGIYSNYLLILQTIQVILNQVMTAVTASVGNLIATDDSEKRLDIYKDIILATAWLYGFSAIALDCLMTRFIAVFFGAGLEIAESSVHLMCLNFYLAGIRQPNLMYINAAGLFKPVRFRGFVEAAVNLCVSAIFLKLGMGLSGVLLGTTVSHFATSLWWEPWCVSKYCLGNNAGKSFMMMNLLSGGILVIAWGVNRAVTEIFPGGFGGFVLSVLVTALIPNLFFLLAYFKTPQFGFFKGITVRIARRILRK